MTKRVFLFCLAAFSASVFGTSASGANAVAHRPKVVLLIAEPEYKTSETLPKFATQFLAKEFDVAIVSGSTAPGEMGFDRIDEIKMADVLLISVRRRTPPAAQMQVIRDYIMAGRPVVGIRTASHAFLLRDAKPAAGLADWPGWDAAIFGGSYTTHYADGPDCVITRAAGDHPLLTGVHLPFVSKSKLYKVAPLQPNAQAILNGTIPGQPPQPVAYIAKSVGGGKSFYTSLGGPSDFEDPAFQRLLLNAIRWAAGTLESPTSARTQP